MKPKKIYCNRVATYYNRMRGTAGAGEAQLSLDPRTGERGSLGTWASLHRWRSLFVTSYNYIWNEPKNWQFTPLAWIINLKNRNYYKRLNNKLSWLLSFTLIISEKQQPEKATSEQSSLNLETRHTKDTKRKSNSQSDPTGTPAVSLLSTRTTFGRWRQALLGCRRRLGTALAVFMTSTSQCRDHLFNYPSFDLTPPWHDDSSFFLNWILALLVSCHAEESAD